LHQRRSRGPEINLSLREKLLRDPLDVSRELPDFDDETDSIETYLDKVKITIDGLNRARIERNLTLGHFAFGRLAMYADLDPNKWPQHLAKEPILQELLRGSQSDQASDMFFASDYDLDNETVENIAPILINDADASQHSAIIDVMNGQNLVIEGPPGTGKSQTITNIIANTLYAGKTILFLSDKLAALQIVKDRMDAAGLGEFCLELHSDKAYPKSIIESLRQRHALNQEITREPNWRADLQQLRTARTRVRDYLSALHKPDDFDDRTPFDLFWSTIAARRKLVREFEVVRRIDVTTIFAGDRTDIERLRDDMKLYSTAIQRYEERHGGFNDAPWRSINFELAPDKDGEAFGDILRQVRDSAKGLLDAIAVALLELRLDISMEPAALDEWLNTVERLPIIPDGTWLPRVESLPSGDVKAASELVEQRIGLGRGDERAVPQNIDAGAIGSLSPDVRKLGLLSASPSAIDACSEVMGRLKTPLVEGLTTFERLAGVFGPTSELTVATAAALANAVTLSRVIPPTLYDFLSFDRAEDEPILNEGCKQVQRLAETEQAIRRRFVCNDADWPSVEDLRFAAKLSSSVGIGRIIAILIGRRRRAKWIVGTLGGGLDAPQIASD
jgi:hypothetical protein